MANSTPIEKARAAKPKALSIFGGLVAVNGVGITKVGDGYGLKVNLSEAPSQRVDLPTEVDGVPVVIEVVGAITKQ